MAHHTPRVAALRARLARLPTAVLLAPLLALGLWPFVPLLGLWPLTTDSALWVSRGSLENPHWLEWAIEKRHFVFYRPVAALSYTLSYALGGYDGAAYRGSDLALHGAVAVLVYALFRALAGGRGWALFATAFFLAHPVGEEVVPFLARRGYLLMTGFGALSVLAFARGCRRERLIGWEIALSAAALAAGLLATEVYFALVPLYPLLAFHLSGERVAFSWRPLLRSAPPVAAGAAVYALRLAILGNVGGYSRVEAGWSRFWSLLPQAVEYSFFPSSATGEPGWLPLGGLGALAVVAYFAWRGAIEPLRHPDRPRERLSLLLSAWTLGTLVLTPLFGVWFYRHSYPLMVPFALLVAKIAAETFERYGRRPLPLALHLLPQLALLASVLHHSPVLHGLDARYMASRAEKQQRMEELARDLERLQEPAVVYLILPFEVPVRVDPGWQDVGTYGMRRTGFWAQALARGRDLQFRDLAYVGPPAPGQPLAPIRQRERDGRRVIVLPSDVPLRFSELWVAEQTALPLLHLDELPVGAEERGYVYYFNGNAGHLLPLPARRAPR